MGRPRRPNPARPFPWIKPQQARSQATMDRLLDASEELLADTTFDALTIAQVCEKAGANVGSFYNIFRDKQALLECLLERFDGERLATFDHAVKHAESKGMTIQQRAEALVRSAFSITASRPGVAKARVWAERYHSATFTGVGERNLSNLDRIVGLFLECEPEIRHPHPRRAVELAIITNHEIVNRIVWHPHTLPAGLRRMGRPALVRMLTAAFLRELGVDHD